MVREGSILNNYETLLLFAAAYLTVGSLPLGTHNVPTTITRPTYVLNACDIRINSPWMQSCTVTDKVTERHLYSAAVQRATVGKVPIIKRTVQDKHHLT